MYTKSALKNYKGSGVSPVGADQPFIYRDPPKAIYTRKKERVEMGDVNYMLRADHPNGDPTRINEAIEVYGRGRNPMVQVDYGAGRGGKAPYKVEVVRPPLMPVETLNSLSNPRIHQNYAVQSNPGNAPISLSGFIDKTDVKRVEQVERNGGVVRSNPSIYTPTFQDTYNRENFKNSASINNTNPYSASSNIVMQGGEGSIYNRENFSNSASIENANYYSASSNVVIQGGEGSIYKRENFSNSASIEDSNPYTASTNVSVKGSKDSIFKRENFSNSSSIDSHTYYSSMSNVSANGGKTLSGEVDQTKIKDNLLKQIGTNFSSIIVYDPKTNTSIDVASKLKEKNYIAINAAVGKPIILNTQHGKEIILKDYEYKIVTPNIGNTQLILQVKQPDVVLDRNTPLYSVATNIRNNIGYNEDLSRTTQEQFNFDGKLTTFGEYSDRVSKPFYHSNVEMPVGGCFKVRSKSRFIPLESICQT